MAESNLSHKNSTGGLRKLFGSPKKPKYVAPTPAPPDPFLQLIDTNGFFAATAIKVADWNCEGKVVHHNINLKSEVTREVIAKVTFKMFYLPPLPGSLVLPENLDSVESGLAALKVDSTISYKGELSQMGGDCSVRFPQNVVAGS